jgi:hypothetical protein
MKTVDATTTLKNAEHAHVPIGADSGAGDNGETA